MAPTRVMHSLNSSRTFGSSTWSIWKRTRLFTICRLFFTRWWISLIITSFSSLLSMVSRSSRLVCSSFCLASANRVPCPRLSLSSFRLVPTSQANTTASRQAITNSTWAWSQ